MRKKAIKKRALLIIETVLKPQKFRSREHRRRSFERRSCVYEAKQLAAITHFCGESLLSSSSGAIFWVFLVFSSFTSQLAFAEQKPNECIKWRFCEISLRRVKRKIAVIDFSYYSFDVPCTLVRFDFHHQLT